MTNDEQYVPSEDEMRHAYWLTRMLDHHAAVDAAFDRFLTRVKRDAFEEGIATGYMRGYHDSEVGLLYNPPVPPTSPEETP